MFWESMRNSFLGIEFEVPMEPRSLQIKEQCQRERRVRGLEGNSCGVKWGWIPEEEELWAVTEARPGRGWKEKHRTCTGHIPPFLSIPSP